MAITADADTGDGHDRIFDDIAQHDAVHAAQDGIEHGKQRKHDAIKMGHIVRRNMERDIVADTPPRE